MADNAQRTETYSAVGAQSITVNSANAGFGRTRGVSIGVTQSLDFSFDGVNWVAFVGCTAGTVLPLEVLGARLTSGAAAPNAGDVVFLY